MATISVRIDDNTRDALEDLASAEGTSVSDLVRQAAEARLGRDVQRDWSAPGSLAKRDRLHLSLLLQVLQKLDETGYGQQRAAQLLEVVQSGFTGEYPELFGSIGDELPLRECRLVWDILDMFRMIQASVAEVGLDRIREIDELAEHALTFDGFDLNDPLEGRLLDYALHLIETGRWQDLAVFFDDEHERGNSHSPRVDDYQRLLGAYQPIWAEISGDRGRGRDRYRLTYDELAALVRSWLNH